MSKTRILSLRDYVQHKQGCHARLIPITATRTPLKCTCGLDDALRAQEPVQVQLIAFVERERALIEARGKGQSVGYYPSITPSVLKVLERMLRDAQDEGAGPKAQAPGPGVK